ncbi:hypothetical protein D3C87_1349120 [compost metagenome]
MLLVGMVEALLGCVHAKAEGRFHHRQDTLLRSAYCFGQRAQSDLAVEEFTAHGFDEFVVLVDREQVVVAVDVRVVDVGRRVLHHVAHRARTLQAIRPHFLRHLGRHQTAVAGHAIRHRQVVRCRDDVGRRVSRDVRGSTVLLDQPVERLEEAAGRSQNVITLERALRLQQRVHQVDHATDDGRWLTTILVVLGDTPDGQRIAQFLLLEESAQEFLARLQRGAVAHIVETDFGLQVLANQPIVLQHDFDHAHQHVVVAEDRDVKTDAVVDGSIVVLSQFDRIDEVHCTGEQLESTGVREQLRVLVAASLRSG